MTPDIASDALLPGKIWWADLAPVRGREQRGHRPVVVVSSRGYVEAVTTLVLATPVSTTDRGWPNHIRLRGHTGLDLPSWAMTEQIRTLSRARLTRPAGQVSDACLDEIRVWLADFLDLPTPPDSLHDERRH